jgi:hypothetical protein
MSKLFNISPVVFLLASCARSSEAPIEPAPGPPMSAGTVCVDVDQEEATVTVNGQIATSRCTQTTTSYSSSVMVEITKTGFQTQAQAVSLLTTEPIELSVVLQPVDLPI